MEAEHLNQASTSQGSQNQIDQATSSEFTTLSAEPTTSTTDVATSSTSTTTTIATSSTTNVTQSTSSPSFSSVAAKALENAARVIESTSSEFASISSAPLAAPSAASVGTSTISTASAARTNMPYPDSLPGPSGLSRQPPSRPNKRSNNPGSKSDSSTVYQSDSSDSSSSDESPTPKRRISLVPNSSIYRNKTEIPIAKSSKDPPILPSRKRLFGSRLSAFHSTRSSSNNPNIGPAGLGSGLRGGYERFLNNRSIDPLLPISSAERLDTRRPWGITMGRPNPNLPSEPSASSNNNNNNTARTSRFDNLPLLLRNIPEGALPSADEVINFSERSTVRDHDEEREMPDPADNFNLQSPAEFANQADGIESMYSHILSDLENTLREARYRARSDEVTRSSGSSNADPSNLLATFSERLEHIMNQSDAILANLRRNMDVLMDPMNNQSPGNNTVSRTDSNTSTTSTAQSAVFVSIPEAEVIPSPSNPAPNTSTTGSNTNTDAPNNPPPSPSTPTPPMDSATARRIYILRKPSNFHIHNRQCLPRCVGNSRQASNTNNFQQYPASNPIRFNRCFRIRQPRFSVRSHTNNSNVWRPFDDHSYPRDPEQQNNNNSATGRSNVEPIRNLLTLSPRSPTSGRRDSESNEPETGEATAPPSAKPSSNPTTVSVSTEQQSNERSSTPAPFPVIESEENNFIAVDPIADHNYPRDPQTSTNNSPDYITPLVSSLHSTISQISMHTNLLRRQVESIEMIDRARFEVFQLQELRCMWEDIRRHLSLVNSSTSERRSNLSNVRQMMAWTRISDPSSESAQSSTEQSTTEPNTDRPSTSRSSASSSNNESRPPPSYMNRFRHAHIKKRMYWRRRCMKDNNPHCNPRRYFRGGHNHREMCSRTGRSDFQGRSDWNLTELSVSLMIRRLEHLLTQQSFLLGRRDQAPDRNHVEYRVQSERIIQSRLRAARQRLNRVNGLISNDFNNMDEPLEYSSVLGGRNDFIRYGTRLRLSGFIETLTRFIERHNNFPTALNDQIKIMLDLAVLLTDLLLLQIMESIPDLSGSILDPERESLSRIIARMCTNMLPNSNNVRLTSLIRVLHELRVNNRNNPDNANTTTAPAPTETTNIVESPTRIVPPVAEPTETPRIPESLPSRRTSVARTDPRERTDTSSPFPGSRATPREVIGDLNRQLRRLYQVSGLLHETSNSIPTTAAQNPDSPAAAVAPANNNNSNSTDSSMAHVFRLGDLLARLRSVRGRLEQVSQNIVGGRSTGNSSSTTEHEPTR